MHIIHSNNTSDIFFPRKIEPGEFQIKKVHQGYFNITNMQLFNFFLMSSMKYLNHMLMAFKFKIHEN